MILVILVIPGLLVLLDLLVLLAIPTPAKKKTKKRESQNPETPYKRLAATYFPTNRRSIIGDAGLNFSVRNGKRCSPAPRPPRIVLPAHKAGDHWHKTYKSAHGKPSGY